MHIAYILDRYRPLARFIIYGTLGASKLLAQARDTVLALADVAAARERLAKRKPALGGIPMGDDGAPENEHIDPRNTAGRWRRSLAWRAALSPRRSRKAGPGHATSFQLGDDLVGALVIEACPVRADAVFLDIAGLRDGRRRPFLQPSTHHGGPDLPLTLTGV